MMILAIAVISAAASGDVVLRGASPTPEGRVVRLGIDAVVVDWADSPGLPEQVSLDRVREVTGSKSEEWKDLASIADRAWRARSRVERGDLIGAEPLLESLAADFQGHSGPTASVVFESLLRCRLARQAHASAVEPWIAWLTSGAGDGFLVGATATMGSRDVRLVASLPPIWQAGRSLGSLAAAPLPDGQPSVASALRELYCSAARFEIDGVELEATYSSADPAVAFVHDIVIARAGSARARALARESLRKRLESEVIGWAQAWCRAGIGRSLLREDDLESKRRAIIELLAVHVQHGDEVPYLAGLVLSDAASACESIGDVATAAVLWSEIGERYPGHPSATAARRAGRAARNAAVEVPAEPASEVLPPLDEGG